MGTVSSCPQYDNPLMALLVTAEESIFLGTLIANPIWFREPRDIVALLKEKGR